VPIIINGTCQHIYLQKANFPKIAVSGTIKIIAPTVRIIFLWILMLDMP
jgi:hypothetical protein